MLINQHIFDNVQQQQQRSLSPKTMGLSMDPQQTNRLIAQHTKQSS